MNYYIQKTDESQQNKAGSITEIDGRYYDMFADCDKSFYDVSRSLKEAGIKNYYFMFEIKNPKVAALDPYSKDLSDYQKISIVTEIHENMWYFLRILRYKIDGKMDGRYILTRGLAAACWNFLQNRNFYLCDNRQTYKTTGLLAGPMLWSFISSYNRSMAIDSEFSSDSRRNLSRFKDIMECLPDYIHNVVSMNESKLLCNRSKIVSALLHNRIEVLPGAETAEAAKNVTLDCSLDTILIDDAEYISFFSTIFESMLPSVALGKSVAKGTGCIMMTSTTNFDYSLDGRLIPDLLIPWSEKMYDETKERIDRYMEKYMNQSNRIIPALYLDYRINM